LTADAEGTLGLQEKIRRALRNVDKAITDNETAVKDTLLNFETFTASLSGSGERITNVINTADGGISSVDSALTKTQDFLGSLGSDKYGGELLPTVISMRELIESFDRKSGQLIAVTRKMIGDVSASVNKAGQKFGGPPPRR
jgi:phospholipid/cholesterol/gamma-HCH transport system substrate-binding protein